MGLSKCRRSISPGGPLAPTGYNANLDPLDRASRPPPASPSSGGSAIPRLNRDSAFSIRQLLPNRSILRELDYCASAIFTRRGYLDEEPRILAARRDALLPKSTLQAFRFGQRRYSCAMGARTTYVTGMK